MKEEQAFTKLIKQNGGIIYKITRLYTDDTESQKDLYQEIVYQLWKGFKTFRGEAKITTWMYRIALNTALLHLKRKKRSGYKVSLDAVVLKQEDYDPLFEERLKILYSKIKDLGDVDRGIIFLFLEGKKYKEIAKITGLSTNNVGTRMARIKERLRTQINKN
ncbi:RNA polymerase sigma factor [Pricia sp.]|uniref:RNA polymerase sigma factor n=1 Tax=Pricia sp. TaxID=2268138 RepID=UPI00359391E3